MSTGRPTISVIINTIDRVGPLRTLLQALEHQSYPFFEVIVVVGPTRDNTLEMLSEYGDRVRVLRCPTANLGRSRNIGLLAARGDIVAFIDDDAVPSCRWLEQIARLFVNENLDATGGAVYLAHPNNPTTQHRIGIISSLAEQIDVRSSWLEHLVPPGDGSVWVARMMGTNMAFRRRSLMEVGGFDEFFEWVYDDSDVALRLTSAGKIVHPVKEAVVYHFPASSRTRVYIHGQMVASNQVSRLFLHQERAGSGGHLSCYCTPCPSFGPWPLAMVWTSMAGGKIEFLAIGAYALCRYLRRNSRCISWCVFASPADFSRLWG
jgi:glycosyltransferase involved in cell wall biosynthesis